MESPGWNIGEMISGALFVGGTVGLSVLPLLDGHERDGATYAALMLCAGLGAFFFAVFTDEFRWGRTNIPMPTWLGRLLLGGIGLGTLYGAWRVWLLG
jgi:hypothetical protein